MVNRLNGFVFILVVFLCPGISVFAQADQSMDQAVPGTGSDETVSPSDHRYTLEEFDALPDEEKIDIYLNFPKLLPEGLDFEAYMYLFHPELAPADGASGSSDIPITE